MSAAPSGGATRRVTAAPASGPAVSISGTATASGSTTSNVYTSAALDIGAAATDRTVVVAGSYRINGDPISGTIGGIDATILVSKRETGLGTHAGAFIMWAAVPTGTSAVVTITWSGLDGEVGGSVFRMTGAGASSDTDSDAVFELATTTIDALTIPANGAAVLCCIGSNDPEGVAWTGATEYSDFDFGTAQHSAAYTTTASETTPAITAVQTTEAGQGIATVGVAFLPTGNVTKRVTQ